MNNQKLILRVNPVIDHSVRSLCLRPYRNHPKGCPNFNKKDGCPPTARLYDIVYDLEKPIFAVINVFDLKTHIEKMRVNNPTWTQYQLACCLYWQPTARKQLAGHIKEFLKKYGSEYKIETCPEAMGVDLISTMAAVGITLSFPPKDVVYQIALAGMKKRNH